MINVAPSSSSHHSNSTSDNGTRHPVRRKGAGCIVTAVVIVVVVVIVVIVIIIVVVVVDVVVSIVAVVIVVVVVPGTLALLSHAILALRGHRVDLKAVVGAEALLLELVLLTIIVVAGEVDLAATGEVGNGPANVLTGAWGVIEVKVHVGAREQDERRNGEQ